MQTLKSLKNIKSSYIREILHVANSPDIISLAGGLPCLNAFPMRVIEKSLLDIVENKQYFQYGETRGHEPLIEQLRLKYAVDSSQGILITSGAQQAIDLCTRAFIERGSNIIVESPSYLGALQAFDLAGANVLSVEQECDGPNIGELELLFKRGDITFFYAVPDFHNPTGCCWSLAKRQKVAELCVEYNVLFIEDAPYRELRFLGEELPTVTSFCADHSIILYSYSKIIAPSIRVGAVIFPMRYLGDLYKLKQVMDLHTSVPMQEIVNQVLRDNSYATNLSRIRNLYYERYLALKNELVEIETIKDDFSEVQGGMFIWLKLNGVCARVLTSTID